ncbi:MAG: hypothetical protein OER77_03845 [Myxococcales bacterium]|nr:hypothetical protein [Myxococcales bacterium]
MTEIKTEQKAASDAPEEESTRPEVETVSEPATALDRRGFLGLAAGVAGLGAAASVGFLAPSPAKAFHYRRTSPYFTGMRPANIARVQKFPRYKGSWTCVGQPYPVGGFGGHDFFMGYHAEGVQGIDPAWANSNANPRGINPLQNTSGLFQQISLQAGGVWGPGGQGPNVGSVNAADTGMPLAPQPSLVGGNELLDGNGDVFGSQPSQPTFPESPESFGRSAEWWSKWVLNQSNEAIRDDLWAAINQFRRVWGLDFDDPAVDGFDLFGTPYQYVGSPDENNMYSLFGTRLALAFDDHGNPTGFIVQAPTLLAPDTAYTVTYRAGHLNPTYTGGIVVNGTPTTTTAASPNWPGKVRDGGFWTLANPHGMDVLSDIQAVRRGERYFTTPNNRAAPLSGTTPPSPSKRGQYMVEGDEPNRLNPQGVGPYWGQWWRRAQCWNETAPNVDDPNLLMYVPSVDATSISETFDSNNLYVPGAELTPARPACRSHWPVGYFPPETGFFWGNYNLAFGTKDPTVTLHYTSEVPTNFRPEDGIPEVFACDLTPNPGSTEINERKDMDSQDPSGAHYGIGLFDSTGYISGFPDVSNEELNGQMQFGAPGFYGRVHGTSYPRSKRFDGVACYHFRNILLWPPRLNTTVLGNPKQPNFGNINWTVPRRGDLIKANPYPVGSRAGA